MTILTEKDAEKMRRNLLLYGNAFLHISMHDYEMRARVLDNETVFIKEKNDEHSTTA